MQNSSGTAQASCDISQEFCSDAQQESIVGWKVGSDSLEYCNGVRTRREEGGVGSMRALRASKQV